MLPQGTTWLDLATLGIAVLAVWLSVRRDRVQGRVGVRLSVETEPGTLVLRIRNTERRTVTAEHAGLTRSKETRRPDPFVWDEINFRTTSASFHGDQPLPKTLEPGDAAYPVRTPLYAVRNRFFPDPPGWAWCEDTYGTLYWEPVPEDVRSAVTATRRRRRGPDDDYGQPTFLEVAGDEEVLAEELG